MRGQGEDKAGRRRTLCRRLVLRALVLVSLAVPVAAVSGRVGDRVVLFALAVGGRHFGGQRRRCERGLESGGRGDWADEAARTEG